MILAHPQGQVLQALLKKEYDEVLKVIDGRQTNSNFQFSRLDGQIEFYHFHIKTPELLASLIHFVLGNQDMVKANGQKAR